jgi:glutathione S-transferase
MPSTALPWRRSASSTCSTDASLKANASPAIATRSPTSRFGQYNQYGGADFLRVQDYKNLQRWTTMIGQRPAVKRGRKINRLTAA